jgi:hypothetical protein
VVAQCALRFGSLGRVPRPGPSVDFRGSIPRPARFASYASRPGSPPSTQGLAFLAVSSYQDRTCWIRSRIHLIYSPVFLRRSPGPGCAAALRPPPTACSGVPPCACREGGGLAPLGRSGSPLERIANRNTIAMSHAHASHSTTNRSHRIRRQDGELDDSR